MKMAFEQTRPGEESNPKAAEKQPRETAKVGVGASKKSPTGDTKSISPAFLAVTALLAITTLFLFIAKNNLAAKNKELQGQLDAAISSKAVVERQLSETSAIKDQLQVTVDSMKKDAEAFAAMIEQEKRQKEEAVAQLQQYMQKLTSTKKALESERQQAISMKDKFKKDLDAIMVQLQEVKTAKESLENKLKQTLASKGIKLEKIVVRPETGEMVSEGQILVVNREFDFVVINLGENDGLKVGSRLEVYTGDEKIGIVEVEKIYGNMSAATILPETQKDKVKEGCSVRPV